MHVPNLFENSQVMQKSYTFFCVTSSWFVKIHIHNQFSVEDGFLIWKLKKRNNFEFTYCFQIDVKYFWLLIHWFEFKRQIIDYLQWFSWFMWYTFTVSIEINSKESLRFFRLCSTGNKVNGNEITGICKRKNVIITKNKRYADYLENIQHSWRNDIYV